eukprot:scaffold90043_cov75-Phaeocystis_antarctica.AAC.2
MHDTIRCVTARKHAALHEVTMHPGRAYRMCPCAGRLGASTRRRVDARRAGGHPHRTASGLALRRAARACRQSPCLVRGRHAGPEARAADRADLTVELGTRDHAADDVLACWQEVCHRRDEESSAQLAIAVPLSHALSQVASTALLPQTDLLRRMFGPGDPSGDDFFLTRGSF